MQPIETWKRAQNLQVATLEEGALLGRLDDFLFDLESHRIYGWRLKGGGMFGKAGGVRVEDVLLIGRDLALIRTEGAVEWSAAKPSVLEGRAWASAYKGTQAITRKGGALGAVQDFVIDRSGGQVTGLLLSSGAVLPLNGRVNTGAAACIAESADVAVILAGAEGDDRTDWWVRIKDAVGGKGAKPAIAAEEVEGELIEAGRDED
ncbi:MAG: PRC-barrel domain-containing protein [Deltaproteobacteria bacterium]|jgi:uncharacterized protein YrrD|nr:PRC-barrel domain-containing protein [Deltaproteobacteria bacterium]